MSPRIEKALPKLPARCIPKTQRVLIALKPDGILEFRRAITFISQSLSQKGINFRIILSEISNISAEFASLLYTETGRKYDNHRRYMSAGYDDPRIISAPVITLVVEAESRGDFDLAKTLRSLDIIGPTNLEKTLAEANPKSEQKIRQSIRYQLTLGKGARIWPFPRQVNDPMYNRIHCSATLAEGDEESGIIYAGRDGELLMYYEQDAIPALYSLWPGPSTAQQNLTRIPLLKLLGLDHPAELLHQTYKGVGYGHFGENECVRLAFETNEVLPLLLELEQCFIDQIEQESLCVFDFGRFVRAPRVSATIVAICGDTASGKTSLVKALKRAGYQEIILSTNRAKKEGEVAGEDYHFILTEEMIDDMAQERFAGVDRVGKNFYGVRADLTHPAHLQGFRGVLASGPNSIAGVRLALPPGVNFGSVFVDCSAETLMNRLTARGRETGVTLQARVARVKGTKERYAPRLPEFDLIVNNDRDGGLGAVLGQVLSFTRDLEGGRIKQTREAPLAYRMTPQKRLVQYLFDQILLDQAVGMRDKITPAPIDDLAEQISQQLREPLELFITELMRDCRDKQHFTGEDQRTISKIIIPHILNTYLVSCQIFHPWELVGQSPKRLGRFGEHGDPARTAKNLAEIRKVAESIPVSERDIILFLHDIGKVVRFATHWLASVELIDEYNLFEFIDNLSPRQKQMIRLLVKNHQNIGDYAYAFMSWHTAVIEMFADPEARALFCNSNGSVDLVAIQEFLNRHIFMTVCDVSGSLSPKGGLRNINFELYQKIVEAIYNVFRRNEPSYDNALTGLLAVGKNCEKDQLSGMLLAFDPISDQRPEGLKHYWQLILQSKKQAIAEGLFGEQEWQQLLADLAFVDNKYCPHLWWFYFGPEPKRAGEFQFYNIPERPPTSLLNAFVLMSKVIHQVVPNFGPQCKVKPIYYDKNGVELARAVREYEAAWVEHALFSRARDFRVDGDEVTFLDEAGRPLEDIKIKVVPGDGAYILRYEHRNLSC